MKETCLKHNQEQACWAQANQNNVRTMQLQAEYALHSEVYHLFQTDMHLDFVSDDLIFNH